MTPDRHSDRPLGVLRANELSLVASRAAIALDELVRHRTPDLRAVAQLAHLLSEGLSPAVVKAPGKARLTDPETADLLARIAPRAAHGETKAVEAEEKSAQAFVHDAAGHLNQLSTERLAEMREFALQLSVAARTPRSKTQSRSARKRRDRR